MLKQHYLTGLNNHIFDELQRSFIKTLDKLAETSDYFEHNYNFFYKKIMAAETEEDLRSILVNNGELKHAI